MKSVCLCLAKGAAICNSAHGFSIGLESWSMGHKEKDSGLMVTDSVRDDGNNNMAPLKCSRPDRGERSKGGNLGKL